MCRQANVLHCIFLSLSWKTLPSNDNHQVCVLHILKKNVAAFWIIAAPLLADKRKTDNRDLTCEVKGDRFHYVSQSGEAVPHKSVRDFRNRSRPINLFISAVFPHSAAERQASHKKIKDCKMTESRFLAFSQLLSIEPFSETAVIVPRAEKTSAQKSAGEKKLPSRKTFRQSCNLTEWAINHRFSQRIVYYFTVFHLKKSNYCYLSVKTSVQTFAGNVIVSCDVKVQLLYFIHRFCVLAGPEPERAPLLS